MKIAIVHEYLVQYGGAERVLEAIHELFPEAPVYTLLYDPDKMPDFYSKWDIRPSSLSKYKWINPHYKAFFYFYPYLIEQFDFRDFDLVISCSYAYSHGIITSPDTLHITYCHTPMRFAWIQEEEYLSKIPLVARPIYRKMVNHLKKWDIQASKRPDYYIASCQNVADRIQRIYHRDSYIINPPVNIDSFHLKESNKSYYLLVSRLVHPYKRIDLAIQAFNVNGLPLKIVGEGADRSFLENSANKNIEFLGEKHGRELEEMYQNAKALIFPGEDDFGIVPIEANACGCPVIAYRKGGVMESQVEFKTALFFSEPTPESLNKTISLHAQTQWVPSQIRENALRFNKSIFMNNLSDFIKECNQTYPLRKIHSHSGPLK